MSYVLTVPIIALIVAAGITLLGLGLLIIAIFPRRKGKTPYCRNCGYDLSGAVSDVCSECGASLFRPRAVVFGKRDRRRRRIIGAACLTLVGLVPLVVTIVGMASGTSSYRYSPTWLLLWNVQSSSPRTSAGAYLEIMRRRRAGTFSTNQINDLAEICLAEQLLKTRRGPVSDLLVNELGTMYAAGELSDAQIQQMLRNGIQRLQVRARRPAVAGQCLPIVVEFDGRLPGALDATVSPKAVRFDGQPINTAIIGIGSGGWEDAVQIKLCEQIPPETPPGTYELEVDVHVGIIQLVPGNVQWDNFLYEDKQTIRTTVQLVADAPPDYIRLTRNPALDQTIAGGISLTFPSIANMGPDGALQAQVCVQFPERMPIDIAFTLQLEADGRILGTKEIQCAKGLDLVHSDCTFFPVEEKLPPLVDVRLIPNKVAAAKTVDMVEIWGGELLFEDVEVPYGHTATMPHATYVPVLVPVSQNDDSD